MATWLLWVLLLFFAVIGIYFFIAGFKSHRDKDKSD